MKNRTFTTSIIALTAILILAPQTAQADDTTLTTGPTSCWACNTVMFAFKITEGLYSIPTVLGTAMWPLMAVGFAISLVWTALKAFAIGADPIRHMIKSMPAFAVVSIMFITPGALSQVVWHMTTEPIIEGGALIGAHLSNATAQVINSQIPATACNAITPADAGLTDPIVISTATAVSDNICQVHNAVATIFQIGSTIASQQMQSGTIMDAAMGKTINGIGTTIMFSSYIAMADYALAMFEAILKLTLFASVTPFLIYFSIFPSTRGSLRNMLAAALDTFLTLLSNGLVASTTIYLLLMSMTLAMDSSAQYPLAPADLIAKINNTIFSGDAGSQSSSIMNSGVIQTAVLAAFTMIAASMALSISQMIRKLIASLTQYEYGAKGDIATQASSALSKLTNIAMSSGTAGLGIAGSKIGASIGRFLGTK